ncbi:MAG: TAXI family TRAP transporter solute-binding subunit [Pseudomonadota bacterium]
MKSRIVTIALIQVVIVAVIIVSPAIGAIKLRIATGGQNGTYYKFGEDIRLLGSENGLDIEIIESQGSLHNYEMLNSKQVELAIMQADAMAFISDSDKQAPDKLRVLLPLYTEELHLLASRRIKCVGDLMKKKIAMGKFGSGTYISTNQVLFANYVGDIDKLFDYTYEAAIKMLLTNKIDAMTLVAGKPVPLFQKLEKIKDDPKLSELLKNLHFVPITNKKLFAQYYEPATLDVSDYSWIEAPVPTVCTRAVLVHYEDSLAVTPSENAKDMEIAKLLKVIKSNISRLQQAGHPKWNEVDFSAPSIKGWRTDSAVQQEGNVNKLDSLFK